MLSKKIWNHNYAYHKWIIKNIKGYSILDVGCGDGTLAFKLANNCKKVTGIDINKASINKAYKNNNVCFINGDYLEYDFKSEKYDCILFVASIHHMDMEKALLKSIQLLNNNGRIIIVGLSNPSTIIDYIIEVLRIIPSFIISKMKKNKTSEEMNIDVNYNIPPFREVKRTCQKILKKNFKIKYALHYRYLLIWDKIEND